MAPEMASLIDLSMRAQLARLRSIADSYKERAIGELRHKLVSLGIAAGLAIAAAFFLLVALLVGLAAIYLWIAQQYGSFAGLGTVAGLAILVALGLLAAIALRGSSSNPQTRSPEADRTQNAPEPNGSAVQAVLQAVNDVTKSARRTADVFERAEKSSRKTADMAAGCVRNGSREAILATLAATIALGVMLGRR
jgi:ABC-type protease/lipase transport system fused ATPase/permease subunit